MKAGECNDVIERTMNVEGLCPVPLGLSFGNHQTYDQKVQAFGIMETSQHYDTVIPAGYLEKHQAGETTTSHLDFPPCRNHCV
jgi:hypothetical protein